MRIKLKFTDLSSNVDQRKVCYLVDKEKCQKVADLCYLIQKRFFNFGENVSLYHDGFYFPPQESIEVVQENDVLDVKIVNYKANTEDDLQRVLKKRKKTLSSSTSADSDSSIKSSSKCVKIKNNDSSEAQKSDSDFKKRALSLSKAIKTDSLPTTAAPRTCSSTTTLKKVLPLSQLGVSSNIKKDVKQNNKLIENASKKNITSSSDSSSSSSSESDDSDKKNSIIKKHTNIVTKNKDVSQKKESTKTKLPQARKSSTSSDSSSSSSSDSSVDKLTVKKQTINLAQKFEIPKNSTYMVKTKPGSLKPVVSVPNELCVTSTSYSSKTGVDFKITGLNRNSVSTPNTSNLIEKEPKFYGKECLPNKNKPFKKNVDHAKLMAKKDKYENTSEIIISGESFNESGNHCFSKVTENSINIDSSDILTNSRNALNELKKLSDKDNTKVLNEVTSKSNNQTLSKKTERNRRRRLRRKNRRNNKMEEILDNDDDDDAAELSNEHDDSKEKNDATILFAKSGAECDDVITIVNQFQCNASPNHKLVKENNLEGHKDESVNTKVEDKSELGSSFKNLEEKPMINKSNKNFEEYPILKEIPSVGSVIVFKELVLSETYTPEMIYRKAFVKSVDKSLQTIDLLVKYTDEKVRGDGVSDNRFQLQYSEDSDEENQEVPIERNVTINWSGLLELRLISEPFEF
ncbi:nucleolar protein dao-5 isoform X3 [Hydra vulgaris]|uniref:Nucleolar protein dao-5 isoform X3 n=1 Tax=Hydra vulgaris TaxID=6087 RepID=A0ABM4CCL7_HYDVU